MCGIYLLLGSNLGDKQTNIKKALRAIEISSKVKKISNLYETEPWGKTDQPPFLNLVIEICTSLQPTDLLRELLQIEKSLGRVRKEKWGERVIDIDILYYQQLRLATSQLVIPHPGIAHRKFTLIPLVELDPDLMNPITKKTNLEMLNNLEDESSVIKLSKLA